MACRRPSPNATIGGFIDDEHAIQRALGAVLELVAAGGLQQRDDAGQGVVDGACCWLASDSQSTGARAAALPVGAAAGQQQQRGGSAVMLGPDDGEAVQGQGNFTPGTGGAYRCGRWNSRLYCRAVSTACAGGARWPPPALPAAIPNSGAGVYVPPNTSGWPVSGRDIAIVTAHDGQRLKSMLGA